MGRLLTAVVSSAISLYLVVGIPLVALRAQRHFSAPAWVIIASLAIGAPWTAVRSWRGLIMSRRKRSGLTPRLPRQ
jgi:hypothetical protein